MKVAVEKAITARRKPDRIPFRVREGNTLVPFGVVAQQMLERKRYTNGDMVFCQIVKSRHSGHWRFAHALAQLLIDNCEKFKHLDAHAVLKALQVLSGAGCDIIELCLDLGDGWERPTQIKIPRSMAYESMDQGEFNQLFTSMVDWVVENVWPELTREAIEHQADRIGRG